MRCVLKICLFLFVHVCLHIHCLDHTDSVIIELEDPEDDLSLKFKRNSKQVLFQPPIGYPLTSYIPQIPPSSMIESYSNNNNNNNNNNKHSSTLNSVPSCYNREGKLGTCVDYNKCYPSFKIPSHSASFDSWLLAMYDTCSYDSEGRKLFGTCCANSLQEENSSSQITTKTPSTELQIIEEIQENSSLLTKFKIPNWPPPLPTHPPDHTIPPLPTHPSTTTSFPLYGSTPLIITTKKTTTRKPATTVTSSTKKPTTTTTTQPQHDVESAACGSKNGIQDQGKIVGGHNADVNEWPWIAALFNNGRQFCGGSLIDSMHILSAAHCVAHMSSWDVARLTVRLGDYNIKTNSEVRHVEKRVKRVVRHRGFDSRTLYNDISILTLDSRVEFSSAIRPVCLPSAVGRDWAGSTGTVIGWGSIRESGPQPAVLQEVNIPIWSNTDCKQKYGHAAPGGIVEHMLCAGQANRDSCSGDSGGPLMVNNGKWTQVGIVSWGIGCGKGQYPGVYSRVEKFLPWINKNLKQ